MSSLKTDKKHEALQALKFTLFSISAGIIQIGTYTLFYEVFHWAPWLAYLVSLILSVLWNFTFNRKYTFRSDADVKRSMTLVALFYLVFTPLSTWLGDKATIALNGKDYIVLIVTMLVNFITEFLYQKYIVFKEK